MGSIELFEADFVVSLFFFPPQFLILREHGGSSDVLRWSHICSSMYVVLIRSRSGVLRASRNEDELTTFLLLSLPSFSSPLSSRSTHVCHRLDLRKMDNRNRFPLTRRLSSNSRHNSSRLPLVSLHHDRSHFRVLDLLWSILLL